MRIVLDTNSLVYVYISTEFIAKARRKEWTELSKKSNIVFEDVLAQKHVLIVPSVVLVELASVIAGMTRDEEAARDAVEEVKRNSIVVYDDPISQNKRFPMLRD